MWPCAATGPTPAPNAPLWWPEWPVGVCLWSRAKYSSLKEEEEQKKKKDKQKKKLSTSAANYWKNIKVFSVCVKRKKRKEGRGGRRRDSRLMAWLSVSWRIVASRGEARQKLTCRRWLQVERGICLAAKTLYLFLVFSFFPPRPLFIFTSFTISLRLPLFLLLLPVPFFPLLLHAVEAVHKDK